MGVSEDKNRDYMLRALELAKAGCGWVSPNPMVGAVIVKDDRIIGEGYHRKYGELHAERDALARCTESTEGADLYVTLEPCCHHGKQPPCTEAILAAGIRHVYVGSKDPNPLVAGKGNQFLREHGIQVTEGVAEEECDRINEAFFYYIQTKRPFVAMKYAMTMDGKIAAYTGKSQWITGEAARNHVQHLRHRYTAIMVGVGTVLADDPLLTCRVPGGKNPIRIICDTNLRTPLTSQIVQTASRVSTIIATCCDDESRWKAYEAAGCRVLLVRGAKTKTAEKSDGKKADVSQNVSVDLNHLMELLGAEKIDSILLEGGGSLNWSALQSGIVQKVYAYVAPKLFGGADAKTPVEGQGFPSPAEAVMLTDSKILQLGDDILIESGVRQHVYRNC